MPALRHSATAVFTSSRGGFHLADQPEKNRTPLELRKPGILVDVAFRFRHGEDPQRVARERLVHGQRLLAQRIIQRAPLAAELRVAAEIEQQFGRALDEDAVWPVRVAVLRGHHFRRSVERNLRAPGPLAAQRVGIEVAFAREREQRRFGGIAERAPTRIGLVGRHKLRVVAQRHGFEQRTQAAVLLRIESGAVQREPTLRRVARAAHGDAPRIGQPERGHGHFVLRQSARLVRADDARGAERFHRREPPHHGPAPGHALHSHGQRDGHRHGQTLRHQRNHLAQRDHENVRRRQAAQQPAAHHHGTEHH